MNRAIAVFDAGLGSYAIVEAIKKAYPQQDIIYFADRRSFPYGAKTTEELKNIIENSIDFLLKKGASFIVLASNAPSITVLDKIKKKDKVIGIYPPLKDVINDKKKNTLIIGAKVMIESSKLQEYIKKDTQLEAVRNTIQKFTDFSKIKVQRKPNLRLVVQKHGNKFVVQQLSQGEKSLMALVGDIARRLAMLNPNLENPLEGCGIVMIDEADLHLHPQWQRQLIARLTKTFPNCQFVLSTHSPLVISDSKDIVVYSLENGEMVQIPSQYGQDANTVLLEVMDTAYRNELITNELSSLIDLIQDNRIDEAKKKLQDLQRELPQNHLELSKAQLLLRKQEIRHAKNQ